MYIHVRYKSIIYKDGICVQIVKANRKICFENPPPEKRLFWITWTKQVESIFPNTSKCSLV